MHTKKILIYGENWEGTLPNLLYTSLLNKQFETEIFDFTDILPGIKDRSLLGRIKRRFFQLFYIKKINKKFLQQFYNQSPDFVIVCKGLHISSSSLKEIKKACSYLINWNPDDFLNMKNSNQNLITSIPEYDLIVSPREHRFSKYKALGANKILWIDWYYISDLHKYQACDKKYDTSFVGSWSPTRESFIGSLNSRFHIWGGGWEKASSDFKKKHIVYKEILSQKDMSRVFTSSKFNLNMLTHENMDWTNLRIFEVTASGGLLLTEENASTLKYLENGKEVLLYSSADDVNHILSQKLDFDAIATAGMKRIINGNNSFDDRVSSLLDAIGAE